MNFSAIAAALGLAPKSLDQARGTLATAAASLESVSALFANAGLNLETMLAAGPDALKTHLASFGNAAGDLVIANGNLALAEAELNRKTLAIDAVGKQMDAMTARTNLVVGTLAAYGIKADTKPEDFKGLLDSHVKQAAALELAKAGHTPLEEKPGQKTEAKPAKIEGLTGRDRYKADFDRQLVEGNMFGRRR